MLRSPFLLPLSVSRFVAGIEFFRPPRATRAPLLLLLLLCCTRLDKRLRRENVFWKAMITTLKYVGLSEARLAYGHPNGYATGYGIANCDANRNACGNAHANANGYAMPTVPSRLGPVSRVGHRRRAASRRATARLAVYTCKFQK